MASFNTLEGRCLDCAAYGDCPSTTEVDALTGLLSKGCCQELQRLEAQIFSQISDNIVTASCDESVYTGGPGVALSLVKAAAMRGESALLSKASTLLAPWKQRVDEAARVDPALGCSLLCGRAGWLCVEALRCHVAGDRAGSMRTIADYADMGHIAASTAFYADEWLYGRAGYLHGCLLLRHVCGTTSLDTIIELVSEAMLENGRSYAAHAKGVGPLMWQWMGKEYLGAAHGVMGIIFVLLHVDSVVQDAEKRRLLVDTMEWIILQKAPNGNWPAVHNAKIDYLVHFCHGAPGAVHLFCKAYEVLGEPRYLREAEAAGVLVWQYGMLKKGPSLCHGFSGNGYVFLALFRASRDPLWLVRAYHYGRVMLRSEVRKACRTPDHPLSLFEGTAGAACFLLDLRLAPMTSALPLFEVGWLRAKPRSALLNPPLGNLEDEAMINVMLQNNSFADHKIDREESEIETYVSGALEETLGEESSAIDPDENLLIRSMHSALISDFSYRLQERVPEEQRKRVRPRLVFDHPTIRSMVLCLLGRCHCLTCRSDRCSPLDPEVFPRRRFAAAGDCTDSESTESGPTRRPETSAASSPCTEQRDIADTALPGPRLAPFTQSLATPGGVMPRSCLYTALGGCRHSRATDGMTCVEIPGAIAWIGDGLSGRAALAVESPCHQVTLRAFLMDIEPVSVGAYARFVNIASPPDHVLADWLAPDNVTPVSKSLPVIRSVDGNWLPLDGISALWPMINVTWYGANAYSLWANGLDWHNYRDAAQSCLPTEAQWEYAARGPLPANFPWGDSPASPAFINVCWEPWPADISSTPLHDMPLAKVNCELGMSPFGLRHMAGNVWQWCRDTYDAEYYSTDDSKIPDAWNKAAEGPKSERGGSWVGPAHLARSSYRRGRPATAKGPCLGFRCIGRLQ